MACSISSCLDELESNGNINVLTYIPTTKVRKFNENDYTIHASKQLPFLVGSGSKLIAAKRINDFIYFGFQPELADVKKPKVSIFNESGQERFDDSEIRFSVLRNDNAIFSLSYTTSGCAASCGSSTTIYNFDARNGRYIPIFQLINAEGKKAISKIVIKDFIGQIKQQESDDSSQDNSVLERNQVAECINYMNEYIKEKGYYFGSDYQIKDGEIEFSRGACWKYDGPYTATLKIPTLTKYLTKYGKWLLSVGEQSEQPMVLQNQIYSGIINDKYRFKMVFTEDNPKERFASGIYYYDKIKKPIDIFAEVREKDIIISEKNSDNETTGMFKLKSDKNKYVGTWQKIGGNPMKVEMKLAEYQ